MYPNVQVSAALSLCVCLAACTRELPPPVYDCLVRVSGDPGTPLVAVPVLINGVSVGRTNQSGSVKVRLSGSEGELVPLSVHCPAGYRQPNESVWVVLKSVTDKTHVPEYAVACAPELRNIVVAIRAEHGPHLPVLYLGKELARTDDSGTAHILLQQAPDSQFELTIDTEEPAARSLRPQNPTVKFIVRDRDEVLPMAQTFAEIAMPAKEHSRPSISPGPIRL